MVQTSAKIKPGGLKRGFTRDAYQDPGPVRVNIDPIIPARFVIIIATKRRRGDLKNL